jgi:hypothetical protein
MTGAGRRIGQVLMAWDGVAALPHRFGGVQFRVGRRELGHTHGDECVDVRFPRAMRDEVVAAGQADAHAALPDSEWVTVALVEEADVNRALDLLRRTYEVALAQGAREQLDAVAHVVGGDVVWSSEYF